MPSEQAKRDLRWARVSAWWDQWDMVVYVLGVLVCGIVLGAFATSFIDRAERMALMRRHDDDIRAFRIACRATVDERDGMVKEATKAAGQAAQAAAQAAEAASDATDPPNLGVKR